MKGMHLDYKEPKLQQTGIKPYSGTLFDCSKQTFKSHRGDNSKGENLKYSKKFFFFFNDRVPDEGPFLIFKTR